MIGSEYRITRCKWLAQIQEVLERLAMRQETQLNKDLKAAWEMALYKIMSEAPSGSGIDNGIKLFQFGDEEYRPDQLRFRAEFHHMNSDGFYTGWTYHMVKVKPSLAQGFLIEITGPDKNQIKDYLHDVFYEWLREEISPDPVLVKPSGSTGQGEEKGKEE